MCLNLLVSQQKYLVQTAVLRQCACLFNDFFDQCPLVLSCATASIHDNSTPCNASSAFSRLSMTASGMKPKAVSKACTEDADCNENGKCADGGFCICSSGHIGINCQHLLFERTVFSTNFLGSERCLKLIQPIGACHN